MSWGEAAGGRAVPDPAGDAGVGTWRMKRFGVSFGWAPDVFFHDVARYEVKTSSEVKTSQCD